LLAYVAAGKQCPRKFLINADTKLLDLPDARALDNVNTADEYRTTVTEIGAGHPTTAPASASAENAAASGARHEKAAPSEAKARTLRVQYYAILREQAGRSEETLDTTAATPAELYNELRQRHPFQLTAAQLKVALNSEFSDWHTPLRHGDTVVFIPPVAGG
jgi:molybdopterin converting factor subunit 1